MSMNQQYYVYILCSQRNGTLYIGMTNDITRRIYEHKAKVLPGFTCKYNVDKLIYLEGYSHIDEARQREKALKCWKRGWKLRLIESVNPEWKDLFEGFAG